MWDPLVSDTVPLTCGPHTDVDPVDLVNIDQVNTDVIKGLDDVSIWRTRADVMLTSAGHVALSGAATC